MVNQKAMRGLALVGVALFFGVQALTYRVGSFDKAGPGLFPLLVSGAVGAIGLVMLLQARLTDPEPMHFNLKNTVVVLVSLIGFALIAQHLNAALAIVFLVFVSTLAGSDYSWQRNVKISAALLTIAAGFHYLLGLNLPLV